MHTKSRNLFTDGVNSFCHALLGALIHWNFSLDTSLHIFYCSKEIVLYPNPAGHPYPVFEPLKLFYETISINLPGIILERLRNLKYLFFCIANDYWHRHF